jgi:hypothetical protein
MLFEVDTQISLATPANTDVGPRLEDFDKVIDSKSSEPDQEKEAR